MGREAHRSSQKLYEGFKPLGMCRSEEERAQEVGGRGLYQGVDMCSEDELGLVDLQFSRLN